MPILPNWIERTVFLTLNQGPGPVLDIWNAVAFRAVLAAVRLNVFESLADGKMTATDLARRINADVRGVAALLDVLASLGYVAREGECHANTAMTTKWMLRHSPSNFAPYFRYWGVMLAKMMGNLEDSIRQGRAPVNLYEWIEHEPETSRDFQEAMSALARFTLDEVVGKLKLPASARRLLDLGGGHAMYSIALCQKYPQLTATAFDSPQALATGCENIVAHKMQEQVTTQAGNFVRDDLGSGYDVALLFNIIHGNSPEENVALFRKVAFALNPGGRLVVLEQLAGKAPLPMGNAVNSILGLSYFHLLDGRLCSFHEVARWFTESGFGTPRRINLLKAAGSSLIVGIKPR